MLEEEIMPDIDNYSCALLAAPSPARRIRFFAILAVLVVVGVLVFRNAGHWLVREDPSGRLT